MKKIQIIGVMMGLLVMVAFNFTLAFSDFGPTMALACNGGPCDGAGTPMCWHDNWCPAECWYFDCTSDICYNTGVLGAKCGICVY